MKKVVLFLVLVSGATCYGQSDLEKFYDSARLTSNLELASHVNKMAIQSNNKELSAKSYYLTAYLLKKQDNFYEAVINYLEALKIYRELGEEEQIANVVENIAAIYYLTGFYETALDYYYDALDVKKNLNDAVALAQLNSNIGRQFHRLKKYDQALSYYTESIKFATIANSNYWLSWVYDDMGTIYLNMDQITESEKYFKKALENASNSSDSGRIYNNIGYVFLTKKDTLTASGYFKKSLKCLEQNKHNRVIGTLYSNLASMSFYKDSDSSLWFYKQSYNFFKEHQLAMSREYFDVCKKLKELSKERGDINQAFSYSDDIDQLTAELLDLRVKLSDLHNRYQVEAATYKFRHHEKAKALEKQLVIDQYITWALVLLVIILGGLLIVLYKKNKKILFARDTAKKIYQVINS